MNRSYWSRLNRLSIQIPRWQLGDEEKCAFIVYRVWQRVPLADRRRLKKLWRAQNRKLYVDSEYGKTRPLLTIELSGDWRNREFGTIGAALLYYANVIRLLSAAIDCMPVEIAEILVAHELMQHLRIARYGIADDTEWEEELTRLDTDLDWNYSEEDLTIWLESHVDEIERRVTNYGDGDE